MIVDTRDVGDVTKFRQITRAVMQGIASEVPKGAEWDGLKECFLKKNPFEAPFLQSAVAGSSPSESPSPAPIGRDSIFNFTAIKNAARSDARPGRVITDLYSPPGVCGG